MIVPVFIQFVCLFVRGAGLRSETQISLLPTLQCRLQDLGQRHLSDYEQLQEPYPPPQSLPHRRDQNGSSCIAVITSQVLVHLKVDFNPSNQEFLYSAVECSRFHSRPCPNKGIATANNWHYTGRYSRIDWVVKEAPGIEPGLTD